MPKRAMINPSSDILKEPGLDSDDINALSRPSAKKLLIATTVPATIRAFLLPYVDHFRTLGWKVDAMSREITSQEDMADHFDDLIDIDWNRNPLDLGNLFGTPSRIARIVNDGGYDIVHVHTPVAAFVTRFALRHSRKKSAPNAPQRPKIVYTAHGFHFFKGGPRVKNFIFRTLERIAGRWMDRLIVINEEDLEAARKYRIVPEESLLHMPGIGLDFAKYDRERISREEILNVRSELGLKEDDVLFTMIAEFIPRKRHKDTIQALAKMKNTNIHIAFAGEGPLKTKMQELAKSSCVHQRTHFLGFVKDPGPLITASRATLLPSGQEGLARALMESVCLGVPIIGTNARGVKDVIEPRRGLLYPTGDPLALRDAMQQMFEEPYGAVEPDEGWRVERLVMEHEKLYDELLGGNAESDVKERTL